MINAMMTPETTPTTTPMTAITTPIMIGVASLLSCFFITICNLNAIVIITFNKTQSSCPQIKVMGFGIDNHYYITCVYVYCKNERSWVISVASVHVSIMAHIQSIHVYILAGNVTF